MSTVEKLAALNACKDAMDRLDFYGNRHPKCPHCGETCNVNEHEWWKLYEEGEHEVTCPHCDHDFTVSTSISYWFSTEFQEGCEADEEQDLAADAAKE